MTLSGQIPLPICKKCWHDKHFGEPVPVDNPQDTPGVYCGNVTNFGVYVWDNPEEVPYYAQKVA
jgi:hypothetical protein